MIAPSQSSRRAVVFAPFFEPGFLAGGPIRSLVGIVDSLPPDVVATVVTRDRDLGQPHPYPGLSGRTVPRDRHEVMYLQPTRPRQWRLLFGQLKRGGRADVLYINSLWNLWFGFVPMALWFLGLLRAQQVVVAPRGQLSEGSLAINGQRKRALLAVWRVLLRRPGVRVHASTDMEAEDVRRALPRAVTLVSMDPVPLPEKALPRTQDSDVLQAVFVSRISPMKNLLAVGQALRLCRGRVHLTIGGPAEDVAYWQRCQDDLRVVPSNVTVDYVGEVPANDVRSLFARSDVFVFPTRGENFGHVVAESLSASCPVVCGVGTPWEEEVLAAGGRLVRPDDVTAIAAVIDAFAASSPAERRAQAELAGHVYERWWRERDRSNVLVLALDGGSSS